MAPIDLYYTLGPLLLLVFGDILETLGIKVLVEELVTKDVSLKLYIALAPFYCPVHYDMICSALVHPPFHDMKSLAMS